MKKNKREIDVRMEKAYSWLENSFILINKTKIKTWQGVFIIAFVAGVFAALIWSVSMDIQLRSFAVGETASLKISPASITVAQSGDFSVDVMLNTGGKNVVATKAIVSYDASDFTLVSWNTDNSAFSSGNSCMYNNKPCEIVTNDTTSGKITFVLAKPAPGVNITNGKIATLNFRATNNAQADNISIIFEGTGKYTDSDVIVEGEGSSGLGTDILASVASANVQISVPVIACTDFTYSEWSACDNGTQTRVVTSSSPSGCTGGDPVLSQTCQQPVCTDFTYSEWGTCLKNKTQIRTILTALPEGCTGGSPILTQSCTPAKTPPAKGKNK